MSKWCLSLLALVVSYAEARADWSSYNRDAAGTRHNPDERVLKPATVRDLRVVWEAPARGVVTATPIQHEDAVYAGDYGGWFHALDAETGATLWSVSTGAPITSTAAVVRDLVIFGDLAGFLHARDRRTGAARWTQRYDPHPLVAFWGSPAPIGRDHIAIGIATNEEMASVDPTYPCCSARGSVLLIDARDGQPVWHTYLAPEGASGASVWSTPTYDRELGLIFVTTGNNYSLPATVTSDAMVALRIGDGSVAWVNQRWADDTWSFQFPDGGPDYDFGDSAQVYRLPDGRKVVGAGQKSGFYHVLDAATGVTVHHAQYERGGIIGGLFADTAYADGVVYANTAQWAFDGENPMPLGGSLVAISADGATEKWRFTMPMPSPNISGVAVAGGVVYFSTLFGAFYALDAATGQPLAVLNGNFSTSGPSVSGGRVCVGTGNVFLDPAMQPPPSIVCLGKR